jgi:predicted ATP-grasp superfamily ATP-dependent carboligase
LNTKTNRILVLGARSPAALNLARSLSKAGAEVHLADSIRFPLSRGTFSAKAFHHTPSPRHDFRSFRAFLVSLVNEQSITQVIPTCEEAFYIARMKDDFPSHVRVWSPSFNEIQKLHQKADFNTWMRELGFFVPKTESVASLTELKRVLSEKGSSTKWVLKPAYSRFAAHTRIGAPEFLLTRADSIECSLENPILVQEFIQGKEFCTYALLDEGKVLAVSTYHHEFRAGAGAGICFEPVPHTGIEAWILKFGKLSGVTGQVSFDFIETEDGTLYPLECNPRATSGLLLLTTDREFAKLFLGQPPAHFIRPLPDSAGMLGIAMLLYGLPSVRSLRALRNWLRILITARDCVFSWKDPAPYFFQFLMFAYFISLSKREGISELEATTEDIEWNGEILS